MLLKSTWEAEAHLLECSIHIGISFFFRLLRLTRYIPSEEKICKYCWSLVHRRLTWSRSVSHSSLVATYLQSSRQGVGGVGADCPGTQYTQHKRGSHRNSRVWIEGDIIQTLPWSTKSLWAAFLICACTICQRCNTCRLQICSTPICLFKKLIW